MPRCSWPAVCSLGLVVPPLAALAKPLLVPTLLIPLTLALVRLDWAAIAAWRHRAGTAALLIVWLLGVSPILVWAVTTTLLSHSDFPSRCGRRWS